MGFLDNSGDIILDAVLTDLGRYRLAQGNSMFNVSSFALFDDEINYELYDYDHASGSAYYDLEIMQTPILEAFSNNASYGRSKLVSIPRTDLLYLPVLKLNELLPDSARNSTINAFIVAVDADTENQLLTDLGGVYDGLIFGENVSSKSTEIRIDQGLDTTAISADRSLDQYSGDLVETQYLIEIDDRLGSLTTEAASSSKVAPALVKVNPISSIQNATVSHIDDDGLATYSVNVNTDSYFVERNKATADSPQQVIAGPRGTILTFNIKSKPELNTSDYLFDRLGSTYGTFGGTSQYKVIYSNARVTGVVTGYSITVPVAYFKKI